MKILKWSGVALLALIWELLSRFHILDSQFLPAFSQTLGGLWRLFTEGVLFTSMMVSLWRALVGLLMAALAAIPLGLFLGRLNRDSRSCVNPFFRMLSQVNPFSLMPIFILFFGIGEELKIAVVSWVSLWPILFNTIEGSRNVDPVLIKTAKTMAGSRAELFFKVLLPGAASSIFTGLRLGLEMSFFMLVVAEMVGASSGLGWLLHNSAMNVQFVRMYAAILGALVLGYVMTAFLKNLHAQTFFWREETGLSRRQNTGRDLLPSQTFHSLVSLRRKLNLALAGVLMLLILTVGSWQVEVSRREQAAFNHIPHTGHMSAGSSGME
jgi:NitT/TauT family transport system permease protein